MEFDWLIGLAVSPFLNTRIACAFFKSYGNSAFKIHSFLITIEIGLIMCTLFFMAQTGILPGQKSL